MMKLLLALGAAATVGGAAFHAMLKSSVPARNSTVVTSPAKVTLTFSEGITVAVSTISILKADSSVVEKLAVKGTSDPAVVEGAVAKPLAPGKYIVRWRTASSDDGHVTRGVFAFTVGVK